MTRRPPKLTKRQREVLALLAAAPGRFLVPAKGGYLSAVEANGAPVPGTRGVALIVAGALEQHGLVKWSHGCYALTARGAALAGEQP